MENKTNAVSGAEQDLKDLRAFARKIENPGPSFKPNYHPPSTNPREIERSRAENVARAETDLKQADSVLAMYQGHSMAVNARLSQLNEQPLPETEKAAVEFVAEVAKLQAEAGIWARLMNKAGAIRKVRRDSYDEAVHATHPMMLPNQQMPPSFRGSWPQEEEKRWTS